MNKDKKRIGIIIVGVIILIVMIVGVTYAAFTFSNKGEIENSVTTGTITMTYTEGDNSIIINNAIPLPDDSGKVLKDENQVFDFTININIVGNQNVTYEVTAVKDEAKSTLKDNEVRLFLERSTDNTNYTTSMEPSAYAGITVDDELGAKSGEMILEKGTISESIIYYYRLKMWVAKSYELNGDAKSFKVKVNAYGKTLSSKVQTKNVYRRASALHEYQEQSTDGSGNYVTKQFGSLGTTGKLESGDAFDCDTNGDGIYDKTTERFYYVTDLDSSTAVLIYYNNTASGVASNSTTFAYDALGDAYTNGPIMAIAQLPTTSQWTNLSLKNTIRELKDETGTVKKANFSYAGYAARLLTTQELESACKVTSSSMTTIGALNSCNYLFENTKISSSTLGSYGTWLENPFSSSSTISWIINEDNSNAGTVDVNNTEYFGVRPAIEVSKEDMSY